MEGVGFYNSLVKLGQPFEVLRVQGSKGAGIYYTVIKLGGVVSRRKTLEIRLSANPKGPFIKS